MLLSKRARNAGFSVSLILSLAPGCEVIAAPDHAETAGKPLIIEKIPGDNVPLRVILNGPGLLVTKLIMSQRNFRRMYPDGFSIEWGDGKGDGDADTAPVRPIANDTFQGHVYASPGTYHIKAILYDVLPPNRMHSTYWTGTCTVTVP